MYRLGVILGGYVLAGVTLWLWLGARDDLAAQIEACNTQKQQAVAQAERVAREAADSAHAARLAQLEAQAASEAKAREIAEQARLEAESRPARVRTVIRETTDGCLEATVPAAVLDSLR